MYAGIDVGGTKTLVAVLDDNGVITEQIKFPTPKNYDAFLRELKKALGSLPVTDFEAAGVGIPASVLDREEGVGVLFPNLPWRNVTVKADAEDLLRCPVAIENDAKLAGLSEAMLVKDQYQKVLYVTVSTGIGIGLIVNQTIDTSFGDTGGNALILEHQGKHVTWESFASGRAIFEHYGKPARDITDKRVWHTIARHIASGLIELIALTEPELVVIGGSIGTYYDRYKEPLTDALKHYHLPIVGIPAIIGAQRPETAVIYGCYDLAKAVFKTRKVHA